MSRPRSLSYIIGALLVIFSLYTFFAFTRPAEVVKLQKPPVPKPYRPQQPQENEAASHYAGDGDLPSTTSSHVPYPHESTPTHESTEAKAHPIDNLIREADVRMEEIISRQTFTLKDAAAAYRERRGRHPPPGFDLWFQYAMENDAVIVEEFWDQIYHDLNPFWAISPALIRAQARDLGLAVIVKDGKATATTDWFWHEIWGRMIDEVAKFLPDMFIPLNPMDESRLLVRWETMVEYMTTAMKEKSIVDPKDVVKQIKGWGLETEDVQNLELPQPNWNGFNPYAYARRACPPESPARLVVGTLSPEKILASHASPHLASDVKHYFDGSFVTNTTETSNFCNDASIGGYHGALMMPLTCSNTDVLMPMFGGSKFHINNEILLPAPMYWNDVGNYGNKQDQDRIAWSEKQDVVVWRGAATGGRNKPFSWHLFHRHRFVAMTNTTKYSLADKHHDLIFNDFLRQSAIETLEPAVQAKMAEWLDDVHNVAFTDLVCDEIEPGNTCWYTNEEFFMAKPIEFTDHFQFKYLPDIDGNSFSARYRAFLMSNSLPIKATIYKEWHDSRLIAWKHFVPMNNRFSDYYRILEYFIGSKEAGIVGHDAQGEKIAADGRKWSEKVLRRVDMQIYVFRLLLEYGRISDDDRLRVGWVDDLELQ